MDAIGGGGLGRGEALAGEQHGVGQERREFPQVGRTALAQVGERLGGHPGRDGGQCHEFRVGRRFAAERDQRQAGGPQPGNPLGPRLAPAEQAKYHEGRPIGEDGELLRLIGDMRAGFAVRYGAPEARAARSSVSAVESSRIVGTSRSCHAGTPARPSPAWPLSLAISGS